MAISSLTGQPTIVGAPQPVEEVQEEETIPSITIEDLELSVRAYNCLKKAKINSHCVKIPVPIP